MATYPIRRRPTVIDMIAAQSSPDALRAIVPQVEAARELPLAEQPAALTALLAEAVLENRRRTGAIRMEDLRTAGFVHTEIIELLGDAIAVALPDAAEAA